MSPDGNLSLIAAFNPLCIETTSPGGPGSQYVPSFNPLCIETLWWPWRTRAAPVPFNPLCIETQEYPYTRQIGKHTFNPLCIETNQLQAKGADNVTTFNPLCIETQASKFFGEVKQRRLSILFALRLRRLALWRSSGALFQSSLHWDGFWHYTIKSQIR